MQLSTALHPQGRDSCRAIGYRDITEASDGVLISGGRSSIRLTRAGQPNELGYPTIIDVRAGPFQGSVQDDLLDYGNFRTQLAELYASLRGEAKLGSYEGFQLNLIGNGTGGIGVSPSSRIRARKCEF